MLLNLEYLVRCDAWLCTLASNFCRVVDEMRATVGGSENEFFGSQCVLVLVLVLVFMCLHVRIARK